MPDNNKDIQEEGAKKVLVIVVGGNISQMTGKGHKLEPATDLQVKEFLLKGNGNSVSLREGKLSESEPIQIYVDIKRLYPVEDLEKQDSSQVNPKIWYDLGVSINSFYEAYEGFVVLHGLDTLAYTASAISFMFRNVAKPIVFTGSQRPLNFPRSDAPQNIYTSITIAACKSLGWEAPINEVTIYLHDTLFRANRASMSSASSYRSFNSLNYPELATIGEHIDIKDDLILERPNETFYFLESTHKKIQIIDVFPGMSSSIIEGIVGLLDNIYFEKLKKIAQDELEKNNENRVKKLKFTSTMEHDLLKEVEDRLSKFNEKKRESGEEEISLPGMALLALLDKLFDKTKEKEKIDATEILIRHLEKQIAIDNRPNQNRSPSANDNKIEGVILRTYGMGTLPTEVLQSLKKLVKHGIVVMNVTQAHSSRVSFNSDLVSLRLYEHGVISGLDMTSEAAFAKMVVVLSNDEQKDWEDVLQKNIAGEQSYTVNNFHLKGDKNDLWDMSSEEKRKKFYPYKKVLEPEYDPLNFARIGQSHRKKVNIQLRILGLQKIHKGGGRIVGIKIYRGKNSNLIDKRAIHDFDVTLDDLDEDIKTANVSFDITEDSEELLFTANESFYIFSDQEISWSRISIVVYT